MIFVIDIGNSMTTIGVCNQNQLLHHWQLSTDRKKTADEWAMTIQSYLHYVDISFTHIEGIIISSVVPTIMYTFEQMCKKYMKKQPLIIGPGIKTGLNIRYDNPREVGADRIVNAVAAIHLYGGPLIVIDFGTAVTYCYINEKNEYVGGAIAPGISISTEALYTEASKLPRIEVTKPAHIIGTNTVDAMKAGIFYGFVGQVEGIVSKMSDVYGGEPTVVATGELAERIAQEATSIHKVEPHLTLKGLQLIYDKNNR